MILAWPQPVLEPVGTRVKLTCIVHPEFLRRWRAGRAERYQHYQFSYSESELFRLLNSVFGIAAEMSPDNQSIFITGLQQNIPVIVQCEGFTIYDFSYNFPNPVRTCRSPRALVRFYGKEAVMKPFSTGII